MSDLVTYKGAVHIHTAYSDGSDSIQDVIRAAREAQLDFIVTSDHNTLDPLHDGWQGWRDGVLVITGAEITPRRSGHVVALGVQNVEGYEFLSEGEYLREIARQGGVAFVAHPEGKRKKEFTINLERWRHWDTPLFAGIEVWSFMHDWIQDLKLWKLLEFHKDPLRQITGPDPWVLESWDKLAAHRRVAGIAGLDVHARRLLLKRFTFFPYAFMFTTTLTYLRMPALSGEDGPDVKAVIAEMARARAWIVYDILGPAPDFEFTATMAGRRIGMGDVAPFEKEARFRVRVPAHGRIALLRNGDVEAEIDGQDLACSTARPGVYRVEVTRDGHPWIFSNHIYLRGTGPAREDA